MKKILTFCLLIILLTSTFLSAASLEDYKKIYSEHEIQIIQQNLDNIIIDKINKVLRTLGEIVSGKNVSNKLYEKVLLYIELKYLPSMENKITSDQGKSMFKDLTSKLFRGRSFIQAYHAIQNGDINKCEEILTTGHATGIEIPRELKRSAFVKGHIFTFENGLTSYDNIGFLFDDFCKKQQAIYKQDKSICNEITDNDSKEQCHVLYAISTGDHYDCPLGESGSNYPCKRYFVRKFGSIDICKEIYENDEQNLHNCFKEIYEIQYNKNLTVCNETNKNNPIKQQICFILFKNHGNKLGLTKTDCDNFKNEKYKKSCMMMISTGLEKCNYSDGAKDACKNSWYHSQALKDEDVSLCTKMIPNAAFDQRGYCVSQIAKLKMDPEVCTILDELDSFYGEGNKSCKKDVAMYVGVINKDPNVCEKYLTHIPEIELCKESITKSIARHKVAEEGLYDNKKSFIDPNICESITRDNDNYEDRNRCYMKVMYNTGNWNYCDKVLGNKKYTCIAQKIINN